MTSTARTTRASAPARSRAGITTRATALALATAASALALVGCSQREPADLPAPAQFEQELLDQINALRLEQGVGRLEASDCMADQARDRAPSFVGVESVPREDLPAICGDYDYAGENISRSDQAAHEVVDAWSADDLQYPNLVDPQFVEAGVGCVGVAFEDTQRVAEPGEDLSGMSCSVIFQGYAQ